MSRALVVGNGESRKNINLNLYRPEYTIIGCNALHRDFKVDHLICCDRRMADEAVSNPNIDNTQIYVRDSWYHYFRKILKNKNINHLPPIPVLGELKRDQADHWGSGCYAILLAAYLGFEQVDLLGFDLYPMNEKVNNVYKNTRNYAKADSQAIDYSYWIYQTAQIFIHYPNTIFNVINAPEWIFPKDWQRKNVHFKNIHGFTIDSINSSVVQ